MNTFIKACLGVIVTCIAAQSALAQHCLSGKKRGCCVCEQKTCRLNVETEEIEEPCFDVECEDICIPPVRFWWQCCTPKRCPKVRTVKKLVFEKQTKKVCVYDWEVITICRGCYQSMHRSRCDVLGLDYDASPTEVGMTVPVPIASEDIDDENGLIAVGVVEIADVVSRPSIAESDEENSGMLSSEKESSTPTKILFHAPVRVGARPPADATSSR